MITQQNIINRAADLVIKGMNPDFAIERALIEEQLFIREMMERNTERANEVYNFALNTTFSTLK